MFKLKQDAGGVHENTYTSSHCKVYLIMFAKLWSLGKLPNSVPAGNPASSWFVRQCQAIQKWRDEIRFCVTQIPWFYLVFGGLMCGASIWSSCDPFVCMSSIWLIMDFKYERGGDNRTTNREAITKRNRKSKIC